jgi:hypothetical protein
MTFTVIHAPCQTKVKKTDNPFSCKADVARFQITECYLVVMEECHTISNTVANVGETRTLFMMVLFIEKAPSLLEEPAPLLRKIRVIPPTLDPIVKSFM